MFGAPEFLVARPIPALVPVDDRRGELRVLLASLARGGAERIVLDWLDAEARRGRAIELAVVHPRRNAWRAPARVALLERNGESPRAFVESLARRWHATPGAVSTHLIDDEMLAVLWSAGIPTIPTVHNAREGWRNDPAQWRAAHVPHVIACADAVRDQVVDAGCVVTAITVRHMPVSQRSAVDAERRRVLRAEWRIGEATLLVGAI